MGLVGAGLAVGVLGLVITTLGDGIGAGVGKDSLGGLGLLPLALSGVLPWAVAGRVTNQSLPPIMPKHRATSKARDSNQDPQRNRRRRRWVCLLYCLPFFLVFDFC